MGEIKLTWNKTSGPNDPEVWVSGTIQHGLRDAKGREIGGYAEVWLDIPRCGVYGPDGWFTWQATGPGEWKIRTQATRDGHDFGAITRSQLCESLELGMKAAVGLLWKQRRRQERKYGVQWD